MDQNNKTRHLLIAGTGRTGTSFLVQYLAALGLDTQLSRQNEDSAWDKNANAGLEDFPLSALSEDLPYVIKTPWLGQFVEQVLSDNRIAIDAVIIPIRDLVEAATSRVVLERRSIYEHVPWMASMDKAWTAWSAGTPGGMVFSLNPIDQARLLAVDFHHLIHRLVQADVPVIFLEFPRLAEDSEYLFTKLRHLLPSHLGREEVFCIHQKLTDHSKIRIGNELVGVAPVPSGKADAIPTEDTLNTIALRRELSRLQAQLALAHENERKIEASLSWKITRPLRVFKSLFAGWRRLGLAHS